MKGEVGPTSMSDSSGRRSLGGTEPLSSLALELPGERTREGETSELALARLFRAKYGGSEMSSDIRLQEVLLESPEIGVPFDRAGEDGWSGVARSPFSRIEGVPAFEATGIPNTLKILPRFWRFSTASGLMLGHRSCCTSSCCGMGRS